MSCQFLQGLCGMYVLHQQEANSSTKCKREAGTPGPFKQRPMNIYVSLPMTLTGRWLHRAAAVRSGPRTARVLEPLWRRLRLSSFLISLYACWHSAHRVSVKKRVEFNLHLCFGAGEYGDVQSGGGGYQSTCTQCNCRPELRWCSPTGGAPSEIGDGLPILTLKLLVSPKQVTRLAHRREFAWTEPLDAQQRPSRRRRSQRSAHRPV